MSARHRDPQAGDLQRENERLRRELADKVQEIRRQAEEIAQQQQQIADAERQIADLERQLALCKQNSTNSSKPPSSDGLAGEEWADSLAIAERIGPRCPPKESTRFGRSCQSSASTAGIRCPRKSNKCRPPARCSGIKSRSCRPSKLGS
jgi:hypothetical protein